MYHLELRPFGDKHTDRIPINKIVHVSLSYLCTSRGFGVN